MYKIIVSLDGIVEKSAFANTADALKLLHRSCDGLGYTAAQTAEAVAYFNTHGEKVISNPNNGRKIKFTLS